MNANKNKYFNEATDGGQFYDQYQAYQSALDQVAALEAQLAAAQTQVAAAQAALMDSLNAANLEGIHFADLNLSIINQPETTRVRNYDWEAIATNFNERIFPHLDPSIQNQLAENGWDDSKNWYVPTVDPQISSALTKLKISPFFQPYVKNYTTIKAKIDLKPLHKTAAPKKDKARSI